MRHVVSDHFVEYHEMVDIGSGAKREMPFVALNFQTVGA